MKLLVKVKDGYLPEVRGYLSDYFKPDVVYTAEAYPDDDYSIDGYFINGQRFRRLFHTIQSDTVLKVGSPLTRDSRQNFQWFLTHHGYEQLGCGAYSSVYAKNNSSKVIRVTETREDGYLAYLKLIRSKKHRNNPHAPRIFSVTFCDSFYFVVMERLSQDRNRGNNPAYYKASDLIYGKSEDHTINHRPGSVNRMARERRFGNELANLCKDIADLANRGYSIDFHSNNYMVRDDNTLVITDPFAGHSRERSRRASRSLKVRSSC